MSSSEGGIECGSDPFYINGKRWACITYDMEFDPSGSQSLSKTPKTITIYWADGTKTVSLADSV